MSSGTSLEPERRGPQGWSVECWGRLQHVDGSVTPDGPGVAGAISLSPPKSGYWLAFLEEIQANCTQIQWNLWSARDFQTPWAPCVPWTVDFSTGTFLNMTSAMDYCTFGSVVLQELRWVLGLKAKGEEVMRHKPWVFLLVHWLIGSTRKRLCLSKDPESGMKACWCLVVTSCNNFKIPAQGAKGFNSVQFNCSVCATPWTATHQTSLHWSITNSLRLLKVMSMESVIPSNHLILSRPLSPSFHLSQHQGLLQWVSSPHQVTRVLELQLQHRSFQWIFRIDFIYDWLVGSLYCPRDSQESSPTLQFKSINSFMLNFLYGPDLTSI